MLQTGAPRANAKVRQHREAGLNDDGIRKKGISLEADTQRFGPNRRAPAHLK
jgi:hypothetical protein